MTDFAPIFLDHKDQFLHAVYNAKKDRWQWFLNGEYQAEFPANAYCFAAHRELAEFIGIDPESEYTIGLPYLSGRVAPDGKTVFIHDLIFRDHGTMKQKTFDRKVDKMIDKIYKYMEGIIK